MVDFSEEARGAIAVARAWNLASAAVDKYNSKHAQNAPSGLAAAVLGDETTGSSSDRLKIAKEYLQYLEDIGQKENENYKAQLTLVAALEERSNGVSKALRDATIEMIESPEYKAASAEIERLQSRVDAGREQLVGEEAIAKSIAVRVTELDGVVTAAKAKLDAMADAAGVTANGGAGGVVDSLNKQLKEARDTLQYLTDTGSSKASISAAQKSVATLTAQLDAADKKLRIAQYEFEHSPEYAAQRKAVADAEAAAKEEKLQQEAERKRLDAMRVAQNAREQQLQTAEDAQKKRIDGLRAAAERSVAAIDEAAKKLPHAAEVATAQITKAVDDATAKMDAAATSLSTSIGAAAGGGSAGSSGGGYRGGGLAGLGPNATPTDVAKAILDEKRLPSGPAALRKIDPVTGKPYGDTRPAVAPGALPNIPTIDEMNQGTQQLLDTLASTYTGGGKTDAVGAIPEGSSLADQIATRQGRTYSAAQRQILNAFGGTNMGGYIDNVLNIYDKIDAAAAKGDGQALAYWNNELTGITNIIRSAGYPGANGLVQMLQPDRNARAATAARKTTIPPRPATAGAPSRATGSMSLGLPPTAVLEGDGGLRMAGSTATATGESDGSQTIRLPEVVSLVRDLKVIALALGGKVGGKAVTPSTGGAGPTGAPPAVGGGAPLAVARARGTVQ